MEDKTWGTLPTPKIYIELQGEFIDFNKEEEYLVCKFPVQSKYFNPIPALYLLAILALNFKSESLDIVKV